MKRFFFCSIAEATRWKWYSAGKIFILLVGFAKFEFKGELSRGDVKKILDEIKQQEQKIRAEYNKKNDYKERPRDKDW